MIRPQTCPICGKELPPQTAADSPLFPFCSLRCQQIDLWRWCEGKYAVVEPLTIERRLAEQGESEAVAGP
jgi:endogenous inhibitor of DNA gyrase (YacG/DUF329 family)